MIDTVTSAAATEGLEFRFDIARRGNTFDAHRLLHYGLARGAQNELKERLDLQAQPGLWVTADGDHGDSSTPNSAP